MRRVTRWLFPSVALVGVVAAVAVAGVSAAAGDPAPTGKFVIGDQSATLGAQVQLWGAQWWKADAVSGGKAPSSFKGWATKVDMTTCTFTTRPGNSPPPPDAPLDPVMTMLVTSSVKKHGPVITGTISATATVETDPGYDDNPGHAATGTVTDLLSCRRPAAAAATSRSFRPISARRRYGRRAGSVTTRSA